MRSGVSVNFKKIIRVFLLFCFTIHQPPMTCNRKLRHSLDYLLIIVVLALPKAKLNCDNLELFALAARRS